jgi:hypothetical protein
MSGHFPLLLLSLYLIGAGIWQLTASLDVLWQRHERRLQARGLPAQRNDVWEETTQRQGWIYVAVGVMMLLIFAAMSAPSAPTQRAASTQKEPVVVVNDGRITPEESEACGHDLPACMDQEKRGVRR